MKRRVTIILLYAMGFVALSMLASCSTQKNTAASRSFHATKTKYNIYYNGYTSFEDGLASTRKSANNDFTSVLQLYPVSDHKAAESASSQMDVTIEKCRKCIKLHSIKKKPKLDQKKRNDPKYKAWYAQEEFNKNMDDAWILLGKAEFHKGDFLGSIGTFNYITRHYEYDKDVVAQCQLWSARAYGELDWLYEAEDLLNKVNQDDLSRKHANLYASAQADIKIKTKKYREAIPFVKLVLQDEPKTGDKARMTYVLAQLYEITGEKQKAADEYKKVIKLNPSLDFDFNARIRRAELSNSWNASLKDLKKMAKRTKHKDDLDRIYGAMGNIYLAHKDTTKALEMYAKGAEESTRNGMPKAVILITAGDIYYDRHDYVNAAPCYKDAANILSTENPDYKRVKRRSETLDLLVTEVTTVQLQDSLQYLSTLTPEEQLAIAEKIVADLKAKEEADSIKNAQAAREAELGSGMKSVNTANMLGGGGTADWYFYNTNLINSGKSAFTQKWGNRPLEDNWRRMTKTMIPVYNDDNEDIDANDSIPNDTTGGNRPSSPKSNDIHDPQYYLQQIPSTPEEIEQSNALIAASLFKMVYIYQDQVEDLKMAAETFAEFERRFPNDSARLIELYYDQYLNALKVNDTDEAERLRAVIISRYPDSKEGKIVADENYFEKLKRMVVEQDSVFEDTYNKYRAAQFDSVKVNKAYAEENYPLSPLMPKFLFLNAVAVAKTEDQDAFADELRDLVKRYPESEVGAMAKDMLGMMNQGMESQSDGSAMGLLDARSASLEEDSTLSDLVYSADRKQASFVFITFKGDEKQLNNMLYQVALFNFSQFLIKDFDLKPLAQFPAPDMTDYMALQVLGFDSYDEAEWYANLIKDNKELQTLFTQVDAQIVCITEANLQLMSKTSLEEYQAFLSSEDTIQ